MTEPAYIFPDHVLTREVDGQTVLVNLDDERWFGLDAVGADVVERATTLPYQEALASLQADYEVDEVRLRADADRLISKLVAEGLLVRRHGDESG